jgi:hypothetical protein
MIDNEEIYLALIDFCHRIELAGVGFLTHSTDSPLTHSRHCP